MKPRDRRDLHYCSLYLPTTELNLASVFIDAEQTHSVELRQLGKKDAQKGACVDQEVGGVVLGVKAGQNVPGRGRNDYIINKDSRKGKGKAVSLRRRLFGVE